MRRKFIIEKASQKQPLQLYQINKTMCLCECDFFSLLILSLFHSICMQTNEANRIRARESIDAKVFFSHSFSLIEYDKNQIKLPFSQFDVLDNSAKSLRKTYFVFFAK